ncbi:tetratricopeptide repeat domain containing protein [Ophiocordyceps camponoti-floridani]|uniref:Tetratricopeptide repeat domain containing protein n=1 Tax=Ophiocordyceps camponoti-floridani TaxID=2030778 RepID=A0A8H4Q7V6_9HYPO|nr:tetratricopeptide repeat domain containing protein [Ophiocordyceps camponoti-floridani]
MLDALFDPFFLQQIQLSLTGPRPTHSPMFPHQPLGSRAMDSAPASRGGTAASFSTPAACATEMLLNQASVADSGTLISPPSSAAPPLSAWPPGHWDPHHFHQPSPDPFFAMGGGEVPPPYPPFSGPSSCSSSSAPAMVSEAARLSWSDGGSPLTVYIQTQTPAQGSSSGPDEEDSDLPSIKMKKKEKSKKRYRSDEVKRSEQQQQQQQQQQSSTGQSTRWKKACLRCRIQKLKCVPLDELNPSSDCAPCQMVSKTSKKTIHRIACHRGKLADVVLFRSGGLKLTERWDGTTMHDVGDRCSPLEVRTIYVSNGCFGEPLQLQVVSFVSRPGDVTARFWYVREGPVGDEVEVRRKKEIDPYCLASIWKTADYFEKYVVDNAIPAMARMTSPVKGCGRDLDEFKFIKRTFAMAIEYYHNLEDDFEDVTGMKRPNQEKRLLGNLFILWFAIRSAHISGDEKLGMKAETKDETYPLFGKVSLPRMIVAQFDSINYTRILSRYGRLVLQDLESFVFRNQPRWWWTIYLCVFILLSGSTFVSADRYRHARHNHGFRYSIPGFVEDLQDGCNNMLMHWHYYNCKAWPDPNDPFSRHKTLLSELTSAQYDLVMQTMSNERIQKELAIWQRYKDQNGALEPIDTQGRDPEPTPYMGSQTRFDWDHPLYWVSQMFEDRWNPHPTYQREYVA